MKIKILAASLAFLFVAGCTTTNDARMAEAHYKAQKALNQQPLVSMKAKPGENIVLAGVAEFSVYSPDRNVNQFRTQHHPVWGIIGDTLRVATPLAVMGHYSNRIADTVGTYSGDNITGSYNTDESITNSGRMSSPNDNSITNSGRMDSPDDNSLNNTDGRMDSPDDNSVIDNTNNSSVPETE